LNFEAAGRSARSSILAGQVTGFFIWGHSDDDLHPPSFFRTQFGSDNVADQILAVDGFHPGKPAGRDDPDDAVVVF